MKEKEITINEKMLGYSDEDIKELLKSKGKRIVVKGGLFKQVYQYTLEEAIENAKKIITNTTAKLPDNVTLVRWLIKYKNCKRYDGTTKEGNDKWFNPIETRFPGKDNRFAMKKFIESLQRQGWNFRSDHKIECQTSIEMKRAKEEAIYKASINK